MLPRQLQIEAVISCHKLNNYLRHMPNELVCGHRTAVQLLYKLSLRSDVDNRS
eukprot:SAG31_NODE_2800_length_5077_cov_2.098433_2_plen_53_part_00